MAGPSLGLGGLVCTAVALDCSSGAALRRSCGRLESGGVACGRLWPTWLPGPGWPTRTRRGPVPGGWTMPEPDHDQRLKVLLKEFFEQFFLLFFPLWATRFEFASVEWLDKEIFLAPPQGE